MKLRKSIEAAINANSAESGSNTPDFILAEFLTDCLAAWNKAHRARTTWYGPKGDYVPGGAPIGMAALTKPLKSLGQITYEAYWKDATHNITPWDVLPDEVKRAWESREFPMEKRVEPPRETTANEKMRIESERIKKGMEKFYKDTYGIDPFVPDQTQKPPAVKIQYSVEPVADNKEWHKAFNEKAEPEKTPTPSFKDFYKDVMPRDGNAEALKNASIKEAMRAQIARQLEHISAANLETLSDVAFSFAKEGDAKL